MASKLSRTEWEAFLSEHPQSHLLQTAPWGELKSRFGWDVERTARPGCGAQVLYRRLPLGLSLAYVPKGPLGDWLPGLLEGLVAAARARRAFALKIEPDAAEPDDGLADQLRAHGFRPSPHEVQPRRTLMLSLEGSEEELLARMHQKTRYNIRLAQRREVQVRPWEDLAAFGEMIRRTAARDAFGAHVPAYYQAAYELFRPTDGCELLVAEHDGQALAALMVFAQGRRAYYLYGASTDLKRNLMPTYLLQWEAMRWARRRGCTRYDLWGVPDADQATLESQFTRRSDGLWGVYRFKRGFGGQLVRSLGAWDLPLNAPLYALYRWAARRLGD